MKKKYNILILLFLCQVNFFVSAQSESDTFAPLGAKWHYGVYENFWMDWQHYRTFEVIKDTVIEDKQCSVLQQMDYFFYHPEDIIESYEYLHQEQQKVFKWNKEYDTFDLLYDFSAEVGDSWIAPYSSYSIIDTATITVNAVDTVEISGKKLKRMTVTSSSFSSFGDNVQYITERIGGSGYLFLYGYSWDDVYIPRFRCYDDDEISYHLTQCDFITTGISEINRQADIIVTDNFVQLPQSLKSITDRALIININGQCVLTAAPDIEGKISISDIPKGIYFITLQKNNYNSQSLKFIKQ
jgi:hypothetical protein